MKYTPLHVHTEYSLLDGLAKISDLVNKAKEDGMAALAITDHGVMYGAIEFYKKCKDAGLKPIIGLEAYVVENRKRKEIGDENRHHLILLAKNNDGYKNLIKLTSRAHLEGFYYKPRIDWELLDKHHDGLIALSACIQGEIPQAILNHQADEKIKQLIAKFQNVFGKENFFLEVQHHPNIPEQKIVNDKIFSLGKELGIPIAATNDTHYLNTEDAEAHDILICLQTKKTKSDPNQMNMLGNDFSLFASEQMLGNFRGNPEVLENTNKIAEMCNVEIPLGKIILPRFELPEGKDDFEYMKELCYANIANRFKFDYQKENLSEAERRVTDRLEYELEVIKKTGYASYFLIVQDFINWAKNNGIVVGPGRGSAAGSIVSYLLNITNLDPLKYDLLFERFLNPARISMPDIDTDFSDERRGEVIKYVEEKYGKDHVAQIITFGTMAARAAVRDVGRVLELPYLFCDQTSKLIPMGMDLDEAIAQVSEFKELYNGNADAKRLIDFARKLEGVARHASTHACGVVITREPIENYCPTQYARDEEQAIVTQYSLHPVEDMGLLKMDFLGLKNLTIMERACEIIEKIHGLKINLDELPLDDRKTYKIFQDGQTTGVFQFESSGMKRYLKQLKPTNIEDLLAMVSLYRPGPMDLIPDFIDRKHGRKSIQYIHPKLKDSLSKTFGIAIYQEQIMQIARDLAGFSLGEADVLRKAVGKKIASLLAEQKEKFIAGCVNNGVAREIGQQVFAFIEPFAGYGFNRSHAACYAYIAYQTAYLKANYPVEFMASLLTSDQGNMDRIAIEIDECKEMNIEILPPSINESFSTFTVVAESLKGKKPRIRFGMNAIRNVGENVVREIIRERKAGGAFKSLEDFLSRVSTKDLNKKSLEGLIKSGALDLFGSRNQLLDNIDKLLLFIKDLEHSRLIKQGDMFSFSGLGEKMAPKLMLRDGQPASNAQILAWEKEFLGLYVSDHPFKEYQKRINGLFTPILSLKENPKPRVVRTAGVIAKSKKIMTKAGDPMLFVTLEDSLGSLEILIFPRLYKEKAFSWDEGKVIVADGTLSDKDGDPKVLCNQVWELNEANFEQTVLEISKTPVESKLNARFSRKTGGFAELPQRKKVMIAYPVGASKELASKVKMLFMGMPGKEQVFLKINDKIIKTNFLIQANKETIGKIEETLGEGVVERN
ncbi:MAG: DNA polymerase III subunit alpha [Parcubacteria group bacterium]